MIASLAPPTGARDDPFEDPLEALRADLGPCVDDHVELAVAESVELAQLIEQRLIWVPHPWRSD